MSAVTSRRGFLARAGRLAAWLAAALAAAPAVIFATWQRPRTRKVVFPPDAQVPGPVARDGVFLSVENGEVRALSARCSHLGCLVVYDASASVFRCPCHGSVYDARGSRLSGPARTGLAPLQWNRGSDGGIVVETEV